MSTAVLLLFSSHGFGWRIHCSVEVTELSTNKQHTLSQSLLHPVRSHENFNRFLTFISYLFLAALLGSDDSLIYSVFPICCVLKGASINVAPSAIPTLHVCVCVLHLCVRESERASERATERE
jgi:hypothetical protein